MKMHTIQHVNAFRQIIAGAAGCIWAEDANGKEYDLKNELVQYIIIGDMLRGSGSEMQLYASNPNDRHRLTRFMMGLERSTA